MMDNEMEQKKEYVAPQMEVVQFQPQRSVLVDSPCMIGDDDCPVGVQIDP
jgi:hypothetical protein